MTFIRRRCLGMITRTIARRSIAVNPFSNNGARGRPRFSAPSKTLAGLTQYRQDSILITVSVRQLQFSLRNAVDQLCEDGQLRRADSGRLGASELRPQFPPFPGSGRLQSLL